MNERLSGSAELPTGTACGRLSRFCAVYLRKMKRTRLYRFFRGPFATCGKPVLCILTTLVNCRLPRYSALRGSNCNVTTVKGKVYYPHYEENNMKQNITVAEVYQPTPPTAGSPRFTISYLHLFQIHSLVAVEEVTLVSWRHLQRPTCLSSLAGSGRNAAAPRVACDLWGLDLILAATKRYSVLKRCPWSMS